MTTKVTQRLSHPQELCTTRTGGDILGLRRACCAQLFSMRQTLSDFGCHFDAIPLFCDNESAIKLANNPVQHSRTKHIDIRHHFLRDHEAKGDIALQHVSTNGQLADIFTKPLDESRFCDLKSELNILDSRNLA